MPTNKKLTEEELKGVVEPEVLKIRTREQQLSKLENSLSKNPEFKEFLDLQKEVNETAKRVWKDVQDQMVANGIKTIKSDEWGSVTVAERTTWETTDELPSEFTKRVPDSGKITAHKKLTGKPPKGAKPRVTQYLVKKIKSLEG